MDFFSTFASWTEKMHTLTGWDKTALSLRFIRLAYITRLATILLILSIVSSVLSFVVAVFISLLFLGEIAAWKERISDALKKPRNNEALYADSFDNMASVNIASATFFIVQSFFTGETQLNGVAFFLIMFVVLFGIAANAPFLNKAKA